MKRQGTRKWLLWTTWILCVPGILTGAYAFHLYWLYSGKNLNFGTRTGALAFEGFFGLFFLSTVSIVTTSIATVSLVGLWASSEAPFRYKISGTVGVGLAWIGFKLMLLSS
jgi:H+/Cl- antiporter ClcA